MSAKLRTMFRKQMSWSVGHGDESAGRPPPGVARSQSNAGDVVALRQKTSRRRHKTSLGAFEDIIKCPICNQTLQSPKMLICQHTFCKKCLETILDDTSKDKESTLTCPVCKVTTRNVEPDGLPANLSIENVLRAINGSFVEARPERGRSLVVNFGPLTEQRRESGNTRCFSCATACEAVDFCQHCRQVFCKVCQAQHVAQLKDQLKLMIDQLQHTINKLNNQIVEFKEKSNSLKVTVDKEYEEKIAALRDERRRRLEEIDDFAVRGERTAEEIKLRILDSQAELVRQKDSGFDGIDDDNEKINKFLELHKKSADMISKALTWQQRVADVIEVNGDLSKLRERDNSKASNRPRLICSRKDLQRPSGLTMDAARGDIYVACPGSGQVVVLDRQYRIMRRIQNSHMMAPQSLVFVNKLQELFVTDKWKHTIFVYNRKGELLRQIGEKGAGEGQFRCPEGLDVLQSCNWLFVADTGNDRVQILGADGSVKGCIGPAVGGRPERAAARIVGAHNFNQPTAVAVSNNAIVVADCGNHKIKVFNHKGQLMFAIGGFGPFKGLLKSPEVVKLDANGNIIVGDSDNHRVQVFSPQGEFVRSFGGEGSTFGLFGWVSGMLCLPNNEILVADSKNNTLQLF